MARSNITSLSRDPLRVAWATLQVNGKEACRQLQQTISRLHKELDVAMADAVDIEHRAVVSATRAPIAALQRAADRVAQRSPLLATNIRASLVRREFNTHTGVNSSQLAGCVEYQAPEECLRRARVFCQPLIDQRLHPAVRQAATTLLAAYTDYLANWRLSQLTANDMLAYAPGSQTQSDGPTVEGVLDTVTAAVRSLDEQSRPAKRGQRRP